MATSIQLREYKAAKAFYESRRYQKVKRRRDYGPGNKHLYPMEDLDLFLSVRYAELTERYAIWSDEPYTCGCESAKELDSFWYNPIDRLHPYGSLTSEERYAHFDDFEKWVDQKKKEFLEGFTFETFKSVLSQFVKPESFYVTSYEQPMYIINPDDSKTYLTTRWYWGATDRWNMTTASSWQHEEYYTQLAFIRHRYRNYVIHAGNGGTQTRRRCRECVHGVQPVLCPGRERNPCKHGSKIDHYDWSDLTECGRCQGQGKVLQYTMSRWKGLPITFDTNNRLVGSFPHDDLSKTIPVPSYIAYRHWQSIESFVHFNSMERKANQS